MVNLNRKVSALIAVLIAAAVCIIAGIRLATPPGPDTADSARPSGPDTRPSPVAESVETVVRTRRTADTAPTERQQPPASVEAASSSNTAKDWSVVAATMSSAEQAEKRARSLKDTWRDCACTVFPKGDSERYFVVVGTGLDRTSADRLQERATAAGLPGDTYVTKLIRRPGDPQP